MNYQLNWSNSSFTALGITFSSDLENMDALNFEPKISSIRKDVTNWSRRNLTTLGRITVVKTLLLPKLTHLFFSLPSPCDQIMKDLNNLLFNYIWGNKRDRISRKQMIQDYSMGGCKMIEIFSFIKSLKVSWFRRILQNTGDCASLLTYISNCDTEILCKAGDKYPLLCLQKTKNLNQSRREQK